jgi:hypothetical protein
MEGNDMSAGHEHGSDHGHIGSENKKIALLIAVLALVLALSEALGKGAQTGALGDNIEAANLWAFFQAKTIRLTTVRTAAEAFETQLALVGEAGTRSAIETRIADWKKAAARYDSEPETREGRKELSERARTAEARRDRSLAAYHQYEVASAAAQIGIVLASAAIITGMAVFVWIAGAFGAVSVVFCAIGLVAPAAIHLF